MPVLCSYIFWHLSAFLLLCREMTAFYAAISQSHILNLITTTPGNGKLLTLFHKMHHKWENLWASITEFWEWIVQFYGFLIGVYETYGPNACSANNGCCKSAVKCFLAVQRAGKPVGKLENSHMPAEQQRPTRAGKPSRGGMGWGMVRRGLNREEMD